MSKLFEQRNAKNKAAAAPKVVAQPKKAADEEPIDDMPPMPDAVEAPMTVSFCKNWPTPALIAVSETLTKLDEYATDKALQETVTALSSELSSRPPMPVEGAPVAPAAVPGAVPPVAPAPIVASKKKADEAVVAPGKIDSEFQQGAAETDIVEPGDLDNEFERTAAEEGVVEPGELADEFEHIDHPKAAYRLAAAMRETKLPYAKWVAQQEKK